MSTPILDTLHLQVTNPCGVSRRNSPASDESPVNDLDCPRQADWSDEDMPEYTLSSIDGNAEIEINRIEPTPTLLKGGYQIRITSHDPKPARTVITVDHDGFAELLYRILSDDDSLRTDVRQKLFP